ncbi:GNAT family N-acetyltransferase [Spirosoma gilvum]
MTIRLFTQTDIEPLLEVFSKNVPAAFGENERDEYAEFLQTYTDPYFVAELNGSVVGACGHYFSDDQTVAHICWILTDPELNGLGIGSALLIYNLGLIQKQPTVRRIECRTSQVAYRFFEKFGFQIQYTKPDFWAPGLDLYFMELNNA